MKAWLALPFLLFGHFLILIAGYINTPSIELHLDMLTEHVVIRQITLEQSS